MLLQLWNCYAEARYQCATAWHKVKGPLGFAFTLFANISLTSVALFWLFVASYCVVGALLATYSI